MFDPFGSASCERDSWSMRAITQAAAVAEAATAEAAGAAQAAGAAAEAPGGQQSWGVVVLQETLQDDGYNCGIWAAWFACSFMRWLSRMQVRQAGMEGREKQTAYDPPAHVGL